MTKQKKQNKTATQELPAEDAMEDVIDSTPEDELEEEGVDPVESADDFVPLADSSLKKPKKLKKSDKTNKGDRLPGQDGPPTTADPSQAAESIRPAFAAPPLKPPSELGSSLAGKTAFSQLMLGFPPVPAARLALQTTKEQKDTNRRLQLEKCSTEFQRRYHLRTQAFSNPFTGAHNQNLEEFVQRFELWANRGGWTESDKVYGMLNCLDGSAAQAYDRLMSEGELLTVDLNGAIQKLRVVFPTASLTPSQAIVQFSLMRQKKHETIAEYAERFRGAMSQAYVTEDSELAVERWCESVKKIIRPHLLRYTGAGLSLGAVISEAARMEARLRFEDSDSDSDNGIQFKKKRKRTVEGDVSEPIVTVRAVGNETVESGSPDAQRLFASLMEPAICKIQALHDMTQAIAARMQETWQQQDDIQGICYPAQPERPK